QFPMADGSGTEWLVWRDDAEFGDRSGLRWPGGAEQFDGRYGVEDANRFALDAKQRQRGWLHRPADGGPKWALGGNSQTPGGKHLLFRYGFNSPHLVFLSGAGVQFGWPFGVHQCRCRDDAAPRRAVGRIRNAFLRCADEPDCNGGIPIRRRGKLNPWTS